MIGLFENRLVKDDVLLERIASVGRSLPFDRHLATGDFFDAQLLRRMRHICNRNQQNLTNVRDVTRPKSISPPGGTWYI